MPRLLACSPSPVLSSPALPFSPMTADSLDTLLSRLPSLSILVIGDFFLDRYLDIDPALAEMSIETGLTANQVTGIRNSPGAAGTVTNNLCALGVGNVIALGCIGDDGHGFDLERGLVATGVDTTHLLRSLDRVTPTYTKPILLPTGEERERLDVKNRTPTPSAIESELVLRLESVASRVDGILVLDQVQESECGVVTTKVRNALAEVAKGRPDLPVLADSRERIGDFKDVIVKVNEEEARNAIGGTELEATARTLSERNGKPVVITRGPDGLLVVDGDAATTIPGNDVPPPIDIVGAGDSVSASLISALAGSASLEDAARLGVIASSITVQQIGTTGVATPDQIRLRYSESPFSNASSD